MRPHMSTWIKSKGSKLIELLVAKDNPLCLDDKCHFSICLWRSLSLASDKWPNRLFHVSESTKVERLQMVLGGVALAGISTRFMKYRPLFCLATPMNIQLLRSWIIHELFWKRRQQRECEVSLLADMRLREKLGTWRTSKRVRKGVRCTVPTNEQRLVVQWAKWQMNCAQVCKKRKLIRRRPHDPWLQYQLSTENLV